MTNTARIFNVVILLALLLAAVLSYVGRATPAKAAEWPVKNVTLIVPASPGGGYDITARITAPFIQKNLSKRFNVIVKNVAGARQKIGLMELIRAKADGYTIGTFDPLEIGILQISGQLKEVDFTKLSWLCRLVNTPGIVVVSTKSGFKSAADMKNKPVRFASIGSGARGAIAAKVLETKPIFINYDGSSPAALATAQGDCDAFFSNWVSGMRQVRIYEGKLIPLCTTTTERVPLPELKDVPSAKELGISLGKAEPIMDTPVFLVGPPNLSPEIKRMWEETLKKVLDDPEWLAQISKGGFTPAPVIGGKVSAIVASSLEALEEYRDIIIRMESPR